MKNPHRLESQGATERTLVRVGTSTYFVIGFLSSIALFAGIVFLAQGRSAIGGLCWVISATIFVHFCFQKIVFHDGFMSFHRPFFPTQWVALSTVSRVEITLVDRGKGFSWQCDIMDGDKLLCRFNPKLFSFEGIDAMFNEIRRYSPAAAIHDGTRAFRPKSKKELQ